MAQKLQRFPDPPSRRYPWEQWLDGNVWQLSRGEDFTSRKETLLSNARVQARRKGGTVKTRTLKEGGRESLVIQFVQQ